MALKNLNKLTLIDMISDPGYYSLAPDLTTLPLPDRIKIGRKRYHIPETMDELAKNMVYGQRLFLVRKAENDFDATIRIIDGWYYCQVTGEKWNEDNALVFGKNVLTCTVVEIYPVVMHIVNLIEQLTDREYSLLHREPTKQEQAAGIEKLAPYSELSTINFLADAMKIPIAEVFLQPYEECLVRLMLEKETNDYRERYYKVLKEESDAKSKIKSHVRS